jgi:hypothetical protein
VHPAASRQAEADKIAAEIAGIARTGMVLPGSITQRRTRCGRANCGCHADPPRLHGPYWQWTRKIAAKTICRWLSPDQHDDYQPWIDNDRRLHELLARLEALGIAAFEADPRWQQRRRTSPAAPADRPAEPEPAPPDNVGTTRLTCGRPSTQPSYPQLRAKREDLSRWSSSLKERAGVKGVSACGFAVGWFLPGMAAWPYGWLSPDRCRVRASGLAGQGPGGARPRSGRAAAPQASLTRCPASR